MIDLRQGDCLEKMVQKYQYLMEEFNLWKIWLKIMEKRKAETGLIQVGFVGMYYQSNLYLKN